MAGSLDYANASSSPIVPRQQAQQAPDEIRAVIQSFIQFNRRQMIVRPDSHPGKTPCDAPCVERFKLSEIANMVQKPLCLEFMDKRMYTMKEHRTVWLEETCLGWDKRQATLQICIFADGVARCKPQLIFHSAETGEKVRRLKRAEMSCGVDVLYVLRWLVFESARPTSLADVQDMSNPWILRPTSRLKESLRGSQIITERITARSTGLPNTESYATGASILTHLVAEAWDELHVKYKGTIIESFRRISMSLHPNGSEDGELQKGSEGMEIGDWRARDTGNLTQNAEAAADIAQLVKAKTLPAKTPKKARTGAATSDTSDDELSDLVFCDEEESEEDCNEVVEEPVPTKADSGKRKHGWDTVYGPSKAFTAKVLEGRRRRGRKEKQFFTAEKASDEAEDDGWIELE